MRNKFLLSIAMCLALYATTASGSAIVASDVGPTVSRLSQITDIPLMDIRRMFTGKKVQWDDGRTIVLVLLREDALSTRIFARDYLRSTSMMMYDTINNQITAASRNQPIIVDTDREVVQVVTKTPGSIGYANKFIIVNNNELVRIVRVEK